MKVGTDGVLLGAWAEVEGHHMALDIGTGTGLIALMLAQRAPQLHVLGVDIDGQAVQQARENVAASPWPDRVSIEHLDFRTADLGTASFHVGHLAAQFDLIVSNPPFFTEDTPNPDEARNTARHAASLPMDVLIERAARLLSPAGCLCLVVPTSVVSAVIGLAAARGMFLSRRTDVKTTVRKPAKRTLLAFTRRAVPTLHGTLTLMDGRDRTPEYQELTRAFYLR